jgi:hypothetical protein
VVRWLSAYLRGRKASCLYNSSKSRSRIIHSGVPQGSVLSPSLFNLFVLDFPQVASLTESFAGNLTVGESSNNLPTITAALCEALGQIESWADSKDLSIAPNKSSIILFTPDPAKGKFHPQVLYKGDVIPLNKCPKILSITWDTQLTFSNHINDVVARASRRLQILKALAGTSWGQCKETLLLTFKLLIRPLIDYGCAIWYPNASATSIKKLQTIQNAALHIVTGCHLMTPIEGLHSKVKEMMVKDHLELLSSQYLASAMRVSHPSHAVVTLPQGPRQKKKPSTQSVSGMCSRI